MKDFQTSALLLERGFASWCAPVVDEREKGGDPDAQGTKDRCGPPVWVKYVDIVEYFSRTGPGWCCKCGGTVSK